MLHTDNERVADIKFATFFYLITPLCTYAHPIKERFFTSIQIYN